MEDIYDVVVVGAGPAGQAAAGRLAEAGARVAIVEAELVGGECAFYACMPSKALLRPAELAREVERVPGLSPPSVAVDPQRALQRRDEVIAHLDDSSKLPWLESRGIDVLRGHARLTGRLSLSLAPVAAAEPARDLKARQAVILATGSAAAMPPIEGLDSVPSWGNREATTAKEVPTSLLALGGGPVGCELAQAWASLGSTVTLVESEPRLIPGEEPFASAAVEAGLAEAGVRVLTGERVSAVARDSAGGVVAEISGGERIEAAEILVATGRRPRVEGLGLDAVGLEGDGHLEVDGHMRVVGANSDGPPWLYAIGDVNGRAPLTHTGKYQARIAAADILGLTGDGEREHPPGATPSDGATALADVPPWSPPRVTFTDPQVAAVGLTEAEARRRGIEVAISETATDGRAGASFHGRNSGGASRLVADIDREVLVGATFVGFETAEMLHAATIAIVGETPIARLRHAIPAFPTRSEIWLDLLAQLG